MTRKLITPTRFLALLLLAVIALGGSAPPMARAETAAPPKVGVLPFELLAPGEMAYLVEGVRTMLGSRLAAGQAAQLLERGAVQKELTAGRPTSTEDFRALGRRLGADYLVGGILTAVGESVSLDVNVYEIAREIAGEIGEKTAPHSFFATAATAGEVIPAVDNLAREIRTTVLAPAPQTGGTLTAPVITPPAAGQQPTYASPHPERQLHGGWGSGSSPFIRPTDISWLRGYSKSHDIPIGLRAMEAADITGDGQPEFILAGSNVVEVYRRDLGRFTRLAQIRTLNRYPIHFVSTADLNGNGRAEIYVSASDIAGPNSLILEWNGSELIRTHDNIPWYLRAMRLPMAGKALVGQRAGAGSFLMPGLFQLQAKADGTLEQSIPLSVPGRIALFDFVFADLDGDGADEIIAISQNDRLEVLNASGGRLARSDGNFGGTTRMLGGVDSTREQATQPHEAAQHYVPARIVVRDMNQDGQPDIVVVKNIDTLARVFGRLRSYSAGEIHALSWDGSGMNEIWRTRRIDGYIADIQLGPDLTETTEEGQTIRGAELFVGVVLGSDGLNILGNSESAIYVYPVEYRAPEQETR